MPGPDERIQRSRLLYERAILAGEKDGLDAADQALDAVEADLAVARGRVLHGRFLTRREEDPDVTGDPRELALFERAAGLYRALGDERGEAAAMFWAGCFHQVTGRDNTTAVPLLSQSLELAGRAGDPVTTAEALRDLGIADHAAGRLDAARARLEESARLRREAGHPASVAANLIGLAYIAIGQGRPEDARALLAEADALAEADGARTLLHHIAEARTAL
jgi:tetratricopeptide (TPR) repeat protein